MAQGVTTQPPPSLQGSSALHAQCFAHIMSFCLHDNHGTWELILPDFLDEEAEAQWVQVTAEGQTPCKQCGRDSAQISWPPKPLCWVPTLLLCIPLVMGSSLPLPRAAIHPIDGHISPVVPKYALGDPTGEDNLHLGPGGRGSSCPRWDGAHTGAGISG